MTTKNIILTFVGLCVLVPSIIYITRRDLNQKSIADLCYKSESFEVKIKACGEILRTSSERYEQLTKEINTNSIVASGARNQIIRARDEFYKTTLSGLNVDF